MDLIERLRGYAKAEDLHIDERTTLLKAADALEALREDACVMKDALEMMAEQHRCGCGHPHCNNCERDRVCAAALAPKDGSDES